MFKQSNTERNRKTSTTEMGIALLMSLWVLTIMMVLVLSFSYMTRMDTYATLAFKEGMGKKSLAEAGIERSIMELFYRNANKNQAILYLKDIRYGEQMADAIKTSRERKSSP